MKLNKLLILLMLFTAHGIYAAQSVFYGLVHFPSKIENPPPLTLLFKGSEYNLMLDKDSKVSKKGMFEIYDERDCAEFHILITENLKLPHTPDIECLETSKNHPYKLFKLTRRTKTREITSPYSIDNCTFKPIISLELVEYWEIAELDNNEPSIKIPDNTIILLMNPKFIIKLNSEIWHHDDAFIKLPHIIFDDALDEKTLQEVSTKMVFASLDLRCLHKKITKTTKSCAQNCIISVPDPLNCYVSNHARV